MGAEREERQTELEKRRAQRKERAAQRERQKKARRTLLLRLTAALVLIGLAVGAIMWVNRSGDQNTDPATGETVGDTAGQTDANTTAAAVQADQRTEPTQPSATTVIHIAAAGDLNITDQVIRNAASGSDYDFTRAFLDVAPVFAEADLAMLNFEGTLSGEPYGTETGSAPAQIAQQLAQIGVDVVQTANSASIRAGVLGLQSTLDGFYQAGVLPVGTFANERTFRKTGGYSIVEVQGIRIALVGFTKGMDNLGLPEGSESCVNVLYTDYTSDYQKVDREKITQVLKNVASEKPDLTIAMVHWGSENNEEISATQKEIRDLMLSSGVDVILGSHPHLVQSVEYDPVNSTLVAYSLGDFFGDAARAGTAYSVILDVEVTRDNASGSVRVTGYDYTPIYTLLPDQSGDGGHRVVRLQETLSRYESNYLGKITPAVYDDMTYALQRIGERIAVEVD